METVIYEVKDRIAKITMNRPEKRNALNHALLRDLDAAFEQADNDPEVRVVILATAGQGEDILNLDEIRSRTRRKQAHQ